MARTTALAETDLAQIARAKDRCRDLDALTLALCTRRLTDSDIERLRENTHEILAALEIATIVLARGR